MLVQGLEQLTGIGPKTEITSDDRTRCMDCFTQGGYTIYRLLSQVIEGGPFQIICFCVINTQGEVEKLQTVAIPDGSTGDFVNVTYYPDGRRIVDEQRMTLMGFSPQGDRRSALESHGLPKLSSLPEQIIFERVIMDFFNKIKSHTFEVPNFSNPASNP